MLRDVTIYGTAAKASVQLKRRDLAGKTGTTNDYVDAWFCGYQVTSTACTWIGYDQPKRIGETGGVAALPVWIGYMSRALRDVPEETLPAPEGLTAVEVVNERKGGTVKEFFYNENVPAEIPPEPKDDGAKPVD